MEVIRGIHLLSRDLPHVVLTIGNFDGVHLGHQEIIRLACERARALKGTCVAYTFRPHPQLALRPNSDLPLLLTYDEKLEILAHHGVDVVIEQPFDGRFSAITPALFFEEVVLQRLHTEEIFVGHDFAFGQGRNGHLQVMGELCSENGIELVIVPPYRVNHEVVSSTLIRKCLLAGEVSLARAFLGRPFSCRGIVTGGERRGRQLGFPTANLILKDKLKPLSGVYATRTLLGDRRFLSVSHLGVRPTFEEHRGSLSPVLETHLLDVSMELYGLLLEVQFLSRIREERKFASPEELKAQILLDIQDARRRPDSEIDKIL
jgi:riboflavin kinase/FMN adenylyltransferase